MRRIMFLTLAACAAAGIGITLARAEPGPIGQWLMDEPVSLWDWGMRNTREFAALAAEIVETEGVPEVSHQNSFARYDWDNNEIVIELWAAFPTGSPITHEVCNHVREKFLWVLAPPSRDGSDDLAARAGRTLNAWFSHEGFKRTNRDPELGNKLARIVWVEVAVYDGFLPKMPAGSNTVICKARITEEEALSRSWP